MSLLFRCAGRGNLIEASLKRNWETAMNYRTKICWVVLLFSFPCASSATMAGSNISGASMPLVNPDDASINAFQIMCTLPPGTFEDITSRARAMRMRMTLDQTTHPAERLTRHIEVFEGNLTTGPFTLLVEKITKDGMAADNCGVGTSTQDTDLFTQNVIKTLKIGQITPKKIQLNGHSLTTWDDAFGPKSSVNLTDLGGRTGVILQRIYGFRPPSRP